MTGVAFAQVLSLLLLQAPGDGWAMAGGSPGEVKQLYWDLFDTTEVWVRLSPELPEGKGPAPLQLVFQAFFKGRQRKDPPSRIGARVVGSAGFDLSFRLTYGDKTADLTGPQGNSRLLVPCFGCAANGVDAEIKPDVFEEYVSAAKGGGAALGIQFTLSAADRAALKSLAAELVPK